MAEVPVGFTAPQRQGYFLYTKVVRDHLTLYYKKDLRNTIGWFEVTPEEYGEQTR